MSGVPGMKRTPEHNAKIGAGLLARGVGKSPTKLCPRCGETKPREEFGQRKGGFTKTYCPPCWAEYDRERQRRHRENNPAVREAERVRNRSTTLRRYYGLTVDQYEAMVIAQGGVCAICGGLQTHGRQHLDVDHCHETGLIRGLLCSHCNRALGFLFDDPARLRAAIEYLERAKA